MTKFVNVLIQTHHADHVKWVINEAERLGYKASGITTLPDSMEGLGPVQCVHLKQSGVFYLYRAFDAFDLLYREGNKLDGAVEINLRKLRVMMDDLNNPVITESRDNMSVLSVIERPKSEFPDCVCLGVDANTRNTCRMGKAYGGGCQLERATKDDYDNVLPDAPVKFVRPNAENPVVTSVVRFLAVAGTKVLGLIKRAYKHLRGGL